MIAKLSRPEGKNMLTLSPPLARSFGCLLALLLAPAQEPELLSAELKPETLSAFGRYVQATEARIEKELKPRGAFLYLDGLPEPRRKQILAALERGEVYMERLNSTDAAGREIDVPDGLIHHWYGVIFIRGAAIRQALELVEDYDHHQDIYKPEVVRSKLLRREGNDFKIYYRLRKKKVKTVTYNTEHDVHYVPVDATHLHSRSYSTRIAEVENADEPGEHELPVGHDHGFLWRMNSYWRFEEREGGLYIESESVSLTRDIPAVFAWIVKPFVTSIPRESLQMTLGSTRSALAARLTAAK